MKRFASFLLAIYTFTLFTFAQHGEINIIPKPVSVERRSGFFVIDQKTKINAGKKQDLKLATVLNDYLTVNFGLTLGVTTKTPKNSREIVFSKSDDYQIINDGYTITINDKRIVLESATDAGRFYALQSLLQMFEKRDGEVVSVPNAVITDSSRFRYRGMHLDVGRHFMPMSFVKKYIDLMSQYKFNYFHWHLTEDQGWRIEIKKYPKLTEIGSKRPESVKERNLSPYIGDGVPVEGFYTQDEIRDVVAYAKARYITVIPEIELPGHSSAALAAYPELGCKQDYKYKVQTTWGIFKEVYCPTEKTFQFLEDVLTETIALFPDSPYIHIGGDEVLKDFWKDSPEVKELMTKGNLKDEHEVQSYFVRRMEKFINSKGKKIIGWDEILEGGLAPNATVMSWRGMKGGIEAARSHHDVIMTPSDFVYFDYGQGDPAYEPLNIGSYVPLSKVYSFDPVPKELSPDETKYIIGGQGNVWTEYMASPEKVEYMVFPRMLALAEKLWSPADAADFADFSRRLASQFPRLEKQNVNYRIPEPVGLRNMILGPDEKASIELSTPITGARVLYSIETDIPDQMAVYRGPITLDVKPGKRVDLKTVVELPSGRRSSIYAATIIRSPLLEPTVLAERKPGVNFTLIRGDETSESSKQTGETKSIQINQFAKVIDLKQPFSATFDGYLDIPADGIYELQIDSTWNASLIFDGQRLIDDTGTRDRKVRSAVVPLKAGLHKISLRYNHRGGDLNFRLRYGIKGQGLRQANGGEFYH
ncbi:MAG: family 20 glycosylhydrolase [Pyrinomonadaceae bacterium]